MKLRKIDAYVEETDSAEKSIFIKDIDGEKDVWMKITVESDENGEEIKECDYWHIRELGDFSQALGI